MMKNKIFIAAHKKCDVPNDELYLPVFVGAYGKEDIGFQRDDEGENISSLNDKYCELTGLYWCWKNLDYDYLGLSHYRRYFSLQNKKAQKEKGELNCVLSSEEANELCSKYKVIVPKKRHYYIQTIYKHYADTFDGSHLDLTRDVLNEKHFEYVPCFDELMKETSAYVFNMFIMNRELVNDYCSWLFPILEELDSKVDTSTYTAFEKRYLGRVSERLFNVWLKRKIEEGSILKEEIKEIPYLYIGEINWPAKIKAFLMAKLFHKKYDKSF